MSSTSKLLIARAALTTTPAIAAPNLSKDWRMNKAVLAATILALSSSFAMAVDDGSLTTKAMKDQPGTMGGTTADPTAKPESYSLAEKQMRNQPGVNSDKTGTTATPNAKPDDGSLSGKEMQNAPGAQK